MVTGADGDGDDDGDDNDQNGIEEEDIFAENASVVMMMRRSRK